MQDENLCATSPQVIGFDDVANLPAMPTSSNEIDSHGWLLYTIPCGSLYYSHRGSRFVTDIDLRVDGYRDLLWNLMDREVVPPGWELRLTHSDKSKTLSGSNLARTWINHSERLLSCNSVMLQSERKTITEKDSKQS